MGEHKAVDLEELRKRYYGDVEELYLLCLYHNVSADYILGLPKGLPFIDNKEQDKLAERLKMIRKAKGFTQSQVAERLGIHRCDYMKAEMDQYLLSSVQLRDLCLWYDVSLDYLLGLSKGMPYPDDEQGELTVAKDVRKQLAMRLRMVRKAKGFTQIQVAEYLGLSHRVFYHEYEIGYSALPAYLLEQLCLYYNISADYLLGLPKGMPYPDEED